MAGEFMSYFLTLRWYAEPACRAPIDSIAVNCYSAADVTALVCHGYLARPLEARFYRVKCEAPHIHFTKLSLSVPVRTGDEDVERGAPSPTRISYLAQQMWVDLLEADASIKGPLQLELAL